MNLSKELDILLRTKSNPGILSYLYDEAPSRLPNRTLLDDPHYDIFRQDVNAIEYALSSGQIKGKFTKLVDLGCGDVSAFFYKSLPIIAAIGINSYLGIDKNKAYLRTLKHYIEGLKFEGSFRPLDIFLEELPVSAGTSDIVSIFGHTIGSIPFSEAAVDHQVDLNRFFARNLFQNAGALLISVDDARTPEAATHCYSGPQTQSFLNGAWEKFSRLKPNNLEMREAACPLIFWDREKNAIAFSFLIKKSFSVLIQGEPFQLHSGENLICGYSRRFGLKQVIHAIRAETKKECTIIKSGNQTLSILLAN